MSDALFDTAQKSNVTAFKPGFRMLTGDVNNEDRASARRFRQMSYICMENEGTRAPETIEFPSKPCPAGIMANQRFPTCWDGVNLDSPNHRDHVAYPESMYPLSPTHVALGMLMNVSHSRHLRVRWKMPGHAPGPDPADLARDGVGYQRVQQPGGLACGRQPTVCVVER